MHDKSVLLRDWSLFSACYLLATAYGAVYLLLNHTTRNLSGSTLDFGGFFAFSGVATLLTVGISGTLSKRFGAHLVAAFAGLFCAAGLYGLSVIESVGPMYYALAASMGLGWSFYYAAAPMMSLSDLIAENRKGRYISLISVCVVLGTASMPTAKGIWFPDTALSELFFFCAILSVASSFMFMLTGRLFQISGRRTEGKIPAFNWRLWKSEAVFPFAMVFLGACVFSAMMTLQVGYAEDRHVNYGVFFLTYSLSVIACRIFFGGVLTKANPLKMLPAILMVMELGLTVMLLNKGSTPLYIASAACLGMSYGLAYPLIKTYAVRVTAKEDRHQVISFFTLSYFAGVYFFPLTAGKIMVHFSTDGYLIALLGIVAVYLLIAWQRQTYAQSYFRETTSNTAPTPPRHHKGKKQSARPKPNVFPFIS